jgi:NADH dehydrogenase
LDQLPWDDRTKPEITLVDRHDRFVFLPLLYELITQELETWEIAPFFTELLANTQIQFCQGTVTEIDLKKQQVILAQGQTLQWDRLVLALGGETPLDWLRGAADYAIPFRTVQDAHRLRSRLQTLEASDLDKIRVAIVGGGYSGVELACKLADRLGKRGQIRIIEKDSLILRNAPAFNQKTAQKALSDRGVWLDLETTVSDITAETIVLDYRGQVDRLPVEIVLWTVGNRVVPVIQTLPFRKNKRGQICIKSTLQVMDYPSIFALGDLADCKDAEGQQMPATAQAAFQQADYAGWNLWASLTDRPLLPFRYQPLGEMMTLGTESATLTGLGLSLDGPLAQVLRRLIYLYRMPTLEHQLRVGLNWMTRPLQDWLKTL